MSHYAIVRTNRHGVMASKEGCTLYFYTSDKSVEMCLGDRDLGAAIHYTRATVLANTVLLSGTEGQQDNEVPLDNALRIALNDAGF